MREDDVQSLLRAALLPADGGMPDRDLWPRVVRRMESRPAPHWIDIVLAIGIGALFALVPRWFFVLSYHL